MAGYCRYDVKHQTINLYYVAALADPKEFEFPKIGKMFVWGFTPDSRKRCNETRQNQKKIK